LKRCIYSRNLVHFDATWSNILLNFEYLRFFNLIWLFLYAKRTNSLGLKYPLPCCRLEFHQLWLHLLTCSRSFACLTLYLIRLILLLFFGIFTNRKKLAISFIIQLILYMVWQCICIVWLGIWIPIRYFFLMVRLTHLPLSIISCRLLL
jgi:hypothetical protein